MEWVLKAKSFIPMDGPDITKNVQSACDCNRKHRIKKNIRKAPTGLVIPTELVSSISPSEPTETAKDSLGYYCRIFLAGGFAGMCLIATGHPLDTIKVPNFRPLKPSELSIIKQQHTPMLTWGAYLQIDVSAMRTFRTRFFPDEQLGIVIPSTN